MGKKVASKEWIDDELGGSVELAEDRYLIADAANFLDPVLTYTIRLSLS